MESNHLVSSVLVPMLFSAASLSAVVSEDFNSPVKNTSGTAELGNGGSYVFGTWSYFNGNMGIDDSPEGLGDGSDADNELSTIGLARPQAGRGTNARAIGVIFDGALFTNGVEYTVSFDVTGDDSGDNTGRYWLAEVYGYDSDDGIAFDATHNGWGAGAGSPKPFTTSGAGGNSVVNFLEDSASNGVAIEGDTVAGTTLTSFTFTYSDTNSADIAFAVGTYNNLFAIDNFSIVPESSSYALVAGAFGLAFVGLRRRR